MNRQEREREVEDLHAVFREAKLAICSEFIGSTVAQMEQVRRQLRAAGCVGRVVKNTLARRAVALSDVGDASAREKFCGLFRGPVFLVYSRSDPVAPAKVLATAVGSNERLQVKGALFEGAFLTEDDVKGLASLPGRDEVLAQLLALVSAPATQVVRLLNEPASRVVRVIEARRKQLEEAVAA